ncbi:hypothetical protein C5S42_03685 [Candidatus Methanomarinus sp.]|nr:hypothetical protein C5S42_03685 [ANME-2 cluster archaeon]
MIKRCFKTGRQCEFKLEESSDQVFIGISYKHPFKDLFEYGVRPALKELGLRPWIAYEHTSSRDIFCKLCEGLQSSYAAIIDISEPNPNVHFELGILAGTSKPFILIKQKGADVSTGLKGMENLEYDSAKELCKLLKKHLIQATTRARTYPKVEGYATYREFYRDCLLALDQSSKKVDLTHIRDEPPQDFEGVSDWFEEVIKWCDEHPYGKVRRLIAVSNNRMLAWAQELAESVKTRPNYNFEVRVCQWTANFPAINMVIFDRRRVFIALTGFGATETAGFQVSDPPIADYFIEYYNNILGKSDDLSIFLDKVAKGEICIDR